ncbi:MAG TPA: type IV toxin-antitoxin system AbiEi family antitoxin [Nostocaceae cyanobacterium]|nr:type IV toxin-antitoxin system AbiEi family antitoxin [Nostocaceae cyanobacterium]
MPPKHPWLQKCIEKLEALPQIKATAIVEPGYTRTAIADAILTIYTPHNQIEYLVEIKPSLTPESLDTTIEYFHYLQQRVNSHRQRILLVTDVIPDVLTEDLFRENIEFIDTLGNIYLNNSSIYILVKIQAEPSKKYFSSPQITNDVLKVAYLLLQEPRLLLVPEEIAEILSIELKTVEASLDTLLKLNYLQRQVSGKYKIVNYDRLLERWELAYVEDLRSKLLVNTFSPIKNIPFKEIAYQILETVRGYKILIGGEVGAALLMGYLEPNSMVLYISNEINYRVITTQLRLKPDDRGKITIIKQFIEDPRLNQYQDNLIVADPLLIHAELLLNPDERLKETANRIYENSILPLKQQAESL